MKKLIVLLCAVAPAILAQDPEASSSVPAFAADWRVTGFIRQGGRAEASMERTGLRSRFVREGDRLGGGITVVEVDYGNRSVTLAKGNDTAVIQPESPLASIVRMSKAGISDDVVVQTVQAVSPKYHLTEQDVESLKRDGVSDRVVVAMLATQQAAATSAKPSEAAAPAVREPSASSHVSRPEYQQVVTALPEAAPVSYYAAPAPTTYIINNYAAPSPPTDYADYSEGGRDAYYPVNGYFPFYTGFYYPARYYGFTYGWGRHTYRGWGPYSIRSLRGGWGPRISWGPHVSWGPHGSWGRGIWVHRVGGRHWP